MAETSAIIPASGLGERLSSQPGKAFVSIAGQPMLAHTVRVFQECRDIDEIVLVVQSDRVADAESLVSEYGFGKVKSIVVGGSVRQDSVRNGLAHVSSGCEIIAIHDAARPLVTPDIVSASIAAAKSDGTAIVAVPVVDTIKDSSDGKYVAGTPERSRLHAIQTPQTFSREIIEKAFACAYADGYFGTDDASLVERLGVPVRIVRGSYENIKVTTPIDLVVAETIMNQRGRSGVQAVIPRVGNGYDIHRFAPGRRLYLGGIELPGEVGLLGHSDADVLIHAAIDAILGAIGAGDIGRHFPDNDPAYKDIRSTALLERVAAMIEESNWMVANLDLIIIA